VGGGISGLAAAWELRADAAVTVVEASGRLGGKLATSEVAGRAVDEGAESFLARVPDAVGLVRELGLGDRLAYPATASAWVWTRGRLRALPARTLLGVPADLRTLGRSRVLSWPGLLRAMADLGRTGGRFGADQAVGAFVGRRLGREVVERLVDPLLGGVYAGRADELSVAATMPALAAAAARGGSLVRAARRGLAAAPSAGPVFATLAGGLGALPTVLGARLAAEGVVVRTGHPVRELARTSDGGWRLVLGDGTAGGERLDADAVILALPAAPAARLLRPLFPSVAAGVAGIDYASVAIVTLAYPKGAAARATGSGFLVPAVDHRLIKAATFASAKWAHLAGELAVIRCSVGRYGDVGDLQRDDADLVAGAADDLAAAIGASRPVESRVSRWGGALPQYTVGHLDRVTRIRAGLAGLSGIAVCGAAYDGVGIAACIRSGRSAGRAVMPR